MNDKVWKKYFSYIVQTLLALEEQIDLNIALFNHCLPWLCTLGSPYFDPANFCASKYGGLTVLIHNTLVDPPVLDPAYFCLSKYGGQR